MKKNVILLVCFLCIIFSTALGADFRFIVMGDIHGNLQETQTILSRVTTLSPQPRFLFLVGDIIESGFLEYSDLTSTFRSLKSTLASFYPISSYYPGIGNHETDNTNPKSQGEKAFHDIFTEFAVNDQLANYNKTVYSVDYDNSRFIMLNSNHVGNSLNRLVDQEQRKWLVNQLTGKTHYFIFVHTPPFPTGSHVGSSLDQNPADRDVFCQILDKANVTMIFSGHEHNYTRRHIDSALNPLYHNKIYQVITGGSGANLKNVYRSKENVDVPPVAAHHFTVVDVSGNNVTVHAYKDDGTLIDNFSVSRNSGTTTKSNQ